MLRFGLSKGAHLFEVLLFAAAAGCAATGEPPKRPLPPALVERLSAPLGRLTLALKGPPGPWPATVLGMRLIGDAPRPAAPAAAVARSVVRANPSLEPFEALERASAALADASDHGMPYGFFAATVLQESAFDERALSYAGAVGIGQFTIDTADAEGIDPFDWREALAGSARLIGRYVAAYSDAPDPYALALAAYNAGPGAVDRYHGVPPYKETQAYIGLVYDRWARILRDASSPKT
jgi:soluble lytic murein transglycosylase-like protein